MEILPGVHQVPGLRWSNAYLLVEADRLTLVDSGAPGAGKKIFSYIEAIGRSPQELEQIILTHSHPDHTGPLREVSRVTGATIAVHQGDTTFRVKTQDRWLHYPGQLPAFDWEMPMLRRIPAHQLIEDGQELPVLGGLQVVHTPGHTPGSLCLYLPQHGVLFTGDTLLGDGHNFRRPVAFPGTNLRDYRLSVERLAQLPFESACVGHGKPLLRDGAARLGEMLDHYGWMTPRWRQLRRWSRSLIGR